MTKYKININSAAPEKKKIEEYKDFNKVYRMHRNMRSPWWVLKNIFRKPKVRFIAFAVFIVMLLLYLTSTYYKEDKARVEKQRMEQGD